MARATSANLWAQDFYEVMADAAEDQINYHIIDNESE